MIIIKAQQTVDRLNWEYKLRFHTDADELYKGGAWVSQKDLDAKGAGKFTAKGTPSRRVGKVGLNFVNDLKCLLARALLPCWQVMPKVSLLDQTLSMMIGLKMSHLARIDRSL